MYFSERCELKKVTITSQDIKVIKRDFTYAAVRDIWNKNKIVYQEKKLKVYIKIFQKLTKVSEDKKVHIQNIKIDTVFQKKNLPV